MRLNTFVNSRTSLGELVNSARIGNKARLREIVSRDCLRLFSKTTRNHTAQAEEMMCKSGMAVLEVNKNTADRFVYTILHTVSSAFSTLTAFVHVLDKVGLYSHSAHRQTF